MEVAPGTRQPCRRPESREGGHTHVNGRSSGLGAGLWPGGSGLPEGLPSVASSEPHPLHGGASAAASHRTSLFSPRPAPGAPSTRQRSGAGEGLSRRVGRRRPCGARSEREGSEGRKGREVKRLTRTVGLPSQSREFVAASVGKGESVVLSLVFLLTRTAARLPSTSRKKLGWCAPRRVLRGHQRIRGVVREEAVAQRAFGALSWCQPRPTSCA